MCILVYIKFTKTLIMGKPCSEETKIKIGNANRGIHINFNCKFCGKEKSEKLSHYSRKKRHYCSTKCYSEDRKTWHFTEQHSYKGVRKNGESKQVYHRNYCKNNPVNISHLKARRYAREKGAIGSHTLKQWIELKQSYGDICAFCKEHKSLSKDHIIPLSKGGSDFIENIQPLCRNCNSKKNNKIINPDLL